MRGEALEEKDSSKVTDCTNTDCSYNDFESRAARLLTVDDDAHEIIRVVLVDPNRQRVEVAAWLVGNGDFRCIREEAA